MVIEKVAGFLGHRAEQQEEGRRRAIVGYARMIGLVLKYLDRFLVTAYMLATTIISHVNR